MMVSIITPTFNNAQYLENNINSVLNQTYDKLEHIVIDGGSTDDTLEILKSYPTIAWKSESDRGMYDAINKGIRMASGEIIAYLNSDDRYFTDTVEIVKNEFSVNPDVHFIYGYSTYISQSEEPICTFRALPFVHSLNKGARINFAQPSCFWRATVHEEVGYFNDELTVCADADFFLRLIAYGFDGKLVRKPLSQFMVRTDSLSKTLRKMNKREYAGIKEAYNLKQWKWSYLFNELLYYGRNIDSYIRYFLYKINNSFR